MKLGTIPQPLRTEAEAVAADVREKWVGVTGKSRPIISEEAWADLIQLVYRLCVNRIEERPEPEEKP
ncbi:MAG: hypothetical protein ACOVQ0_16405 [Novosphingobium sp.]|uniref:hypothetical protein n=1 Tax=Novosphingobium sp. TaxID=1874826 RepID=UPI003B9C8B66